MRYAESTCLHVTCPQVHLRRHAVGTGSTTGRQPLDGLDRWPWKLAPDCTWLLSHCRARTTQRVYLLAFHRRFVRGVVASEIEAVPSIDFGLIQLALPACQLQE